MGRPKTTDAPLPSEQGQSLQEFPPPPPAAEIGYLNHPPLPAPAYYPPYPPVQPIAVGDAHPRAGSSRPPSVPHPLEVQHTQPPVYSQNASVTGAAPGIPVQLKPQVYPPAGMGGQIGPLATSTWTTGLFDCMDDPSNAAITFLVPCVTFGQIAEILDEGRSSCTNSGFIYGCIAVLIGLPCLISCGYRTRLRAKYELPESPAPDWLSHFLFEWCALCQEYRELRNRGFDPAIGWHANVARTQYQQQGVVMVPPTNQTMIG